MDLASLPNIQKLSFDSVSFTYPGHDATLNNVEFDFPTNSVVRVQSAEGAGKSTLLQVMAGLLVPQSGKYLINNLDVVQMSFEDFLPFRLRIGYTFDYGGLINNRTIFDNLMLPLIYHKLIPYDQAKQRVESVIKRFELKKFANERPAHVPGRVRKLGCLLRALVIHPQMLLMDDPSIGLGADTLGTFVDYISELRDKEGLHHIFISSHDEKFMALLPHEIIFMDAGNIYHHIPDGQKQVANL